MSGISTDARRPDADDAPRILTGSEGLDAILGGGLDANRLYLYEGRPGTGKTTIALQFLLEGARRGERVLYITLSETAHELSPVARRHGWSLAITWMCLNSCRRRPLWILTGSLRSSIRRRLNSLKPRKSSLTVSSSPAPPGSCSTACQNFVCLPKTLCVTGVRCW